MTKKTFSRTTQAVLHRDDGPLAGSICQSTTFVQNELGSSPEFAYSRVANPTVQQLEKKLGDLENAPPAVCFSTGLAAETALFLTLLKTGDHVVLGRAVYGGTTRLFNEILADLGIKVTIVDSTNALDMQEAITDRTRLIFVETPANPTLEISDIRALAKIAEKLEITLAVDNTFLTSILQQPLELGADICVYSTTKHIEGHSTALGGAVVSRDEEFLARLQRIRKSTGAIQTPHNAWLTLRGLKTLPLRLLRHSQSAQAVAEWLAQHSQVVQVNYPGLPGSRQHELALQQHEELAGQVRHGGVLSFELAGGYDRAVKFTRHLQLCNLVEHVGGLESLLTHPASMTHADVSREQLNHVGVSESLLRLSVGLEDVADIIHDLEVAISNSAHGTIESVDQEAGLCTQAS